MEHMAAYVTASGGLSREELRQASKAESEAIGREHPGGWGVLAELSQRRCGAATERGRWSPTLSERRCCCGSGAGRMSPRAAGRWCGRRKRRARQVAASVMRSAQDFCVGSLATNRAARVGGCADRRGEKRSVRCCGRSKPSCRSIRSRSEREPWRSTRCWPRRCGRERRPIRMRGRNERGY